MNDNMKCFIYDMAAWGFSQGVNCRKSWIGINFARKLSCTDFQCRGDRMLGKLFKHFQHFLRANALGQRGEDQKGKLDNSQQMPMAQDVRWQ